ncbi:hypothetical protein PCANC_08476 [Puccinia coronata f. sp. avenae]|uniref:Methyltransferase-domain-containing protein n=1 Tax=Puccinia coronata f. sp. avenae TaxID=200324 RepID=A0A2N5T4F8_9BASI|nr:hypothetical protein PCANC_08476 [Puccinia coronata f. sp. avenae]
MAIPALLIVSPSHLVGVTDADEEVFSLYTELAGWSERATEFDEARSAEAHRHPTRVGSLGFVDSGASVVAIRLEIRPPPQPSSSQQSGIGYSRRGRKAKHDPASQIMKGKEIQVELKQDILATTYRSGDTGSIVWRASIDLAELLWYELLFPSADARPLEMSAEEEHPCWRGFLDMGRLTGAARILELGAGTGSLGILCAGMFPPESTASWTVSDQFDLLAIIARNFGHNCIPLSTAPVPGDHGALHTIEEIDWLEVEKQWLKNQAHLQPNSEPSDCATRRYDLILAVDCLYNEALVLPLLRTLDHFASPPAADTPAGPTLVLVVSELRSSDVVELFLRHWLALRPRWSIFRLPLPLHRPLLNLNISKPHYAIWCGWKN